MLISAALLFDSADTVLNSPAKAKASGAGSFTCYPGVKKPGSLE